MAKRQKTITGYKHQLLTEPLAKEEWRSKLKYYTSIVYGFGSNEEEDPYEVLTPAIKAGRAFICFFHDPKNDPEECQSKFPGRHWHIMTQNVTDRHFNDTAWNACKMNVINSGEGAYFKSENVFKPQALAAYLQGPGKQQIINTIKSSASYQTLWDSITQALIDEQYEKRKSRLNEKLTSTSAINELRTFIEESGKNSPGQLLAHYLEAGNQRFMDIYYRKDFKECYKKALDCVTAYHIKRSAAELIDDWVKTYGYGEVDQYNMLDQETSITLMKQWCKTQGIDFSLFTKSCYDILDKRIPKRNVLYLAGESNSGKSWVAASLAKLCKHYTTIPAGTGENFIFGDCPNKRLIIMQEPKLVIAAEQWKEMAEGKGLFVNVKNLGNQWCEPTPMIVTTNFPMWLTCPQNQTPYLNRMISFQNLKPANFLKDINKELNPLWLTAEGPKIPAQKVLDQSTVHGMITALNLAKSLQTVGFVQIDTENLPWIYVHNCPNSPNPCSETARCNEHQRLHFTNDGSTLLERQCWSSKQQTWLTQSDITKEEEDHHQNGQHHQKEEKNPPTAQQEK